MDINDLLDNEDKRKGAGKGPVLLSRDQIKPENQGVTPVLQIPERQVYGGQFQIGDFPQNPQTTDAENLMNALSGIALAAGVWKKHEKDEEEKKNQLVYNELETKVNGVLTGAVGEFVVGEKLYKLTEKSTDAERQKVALELWGSVDFSGLNNGTLAAMTSERKLQLSRLLNKQTEDDLAARIDAAFAIVSTIPNPTQRLDAFKATRTIPNDSNSQTYGELYDSIITRINENPELVPTDSEIQIIKAVTHFAKQGAEETERMTRQSLATNMEGLTLDIVYSMGEPVAQQALLESIEDLERRRAAEHALDAFMSDPTPDRLKNVVGAFYDGDVNEAWQALSMSSKREMVGRARQLKADADAKHYYQQAGIAVKNNNYSAALGYIFSAEPLEDPMNNYSVFLNRLALGLKNPEDLKVILSNITPDKIKDGYKYLMGVPGFDSLIEKVDGVYVAENPERVAAMIRNNFLKVKAVEEVLGEMGSNIATRVKDRKTIGGFGYGANAVMSEVTYVMGELYDYFGIPTDSADKQIPHILERAFPDLDVKLSDLELEERNFLLAVALRPGLITPEMVSAFVKEKPQSRGKIGEYLTVHGIGPEYDWTTPEKPGEEFAANKMFVDLLTSLNVESSGGGGGSSGGGGSEKAPTSVDKNVWDALLGGGFTNEPQKESAEKALRKLSDPTSEIDYSDQDVALFLKTMDTTIKYWMAEEDGRKVSASSIIDILPGPEDAMEWATKHGIPSSSKVLLEYIKYIEERDVVVSAVSDVTGSEYWNRKIEYPDGGVLNGMSLSAIIPIPKDMLLGILPGGDVTTYTKNPEGGGMTPRTVRGSGAYEFTVEFNPDGTVTKETATQILAWTAHFKWGQSALDDGGAEFLTTPDGKTFKIAVSNLERTVGDDLTKLNDLILGGTAHTPEARALFVRLAVNKNLMHDLFFNENGSINHGRFRDLDLANSDRRIPTALFLLNAEFGDMNHIKEIGNVSDAVHTNSFYAIPAAYGAYFGKNVGDGRGGFAGFLVGEPYVNSSDEEIDSDQVLERVVERFHGMGLKTTDEDLLRAMELSLLMPIMRQMGGWNEKLNLNENLLILRDKLNKLPVHFSSEKGDDAKPYSELTPGQKFEFCMEMYHSSVSTGNTELGQSDKIAIMGHLLDAMADPTVTRAMFGITEHTTSVEVATRIANLFTIVQTMRPPTFTESPEQEYRVKGWRPAVTDVVDATSYRDEVGSRRYRVSTWELVPVVTNGDHTYTGETISRAYTGRGDVDPKEKLPHRREGFVGGASLLVMNLGNERTKQAWVEALSRLSTKNGEARRILDSSPDLLRGIIGVLETNPDYADKAVELKEILAKPNADEILSTNMYEGRPIFELDLSPLKRGEFPTLNIFNEPVVTDIHDGMFWGSSRVLGKNWTERKNVAKYNEVLELASYIAQRRKGVMYPHETPILSEAHSVTKEMGYPLIESGEYADVKVEPTTFLIKQEDIDLLRKEAKELGWGVRDHASLKRYMEGQRDLGKEEEEER